MADNAFVFGLPPSLGPNPAHEVAQRLGATLSGSSIGRTRVCESYAELERGLLDGDLSAAWCPPIVCARVEGAGGAVILRSMRFGATTYSSVLLCRADDDMELKELGTRGQKPRVAAWVDEWSMGGYILPRYHLRSRGLDLGKVFEREDTLESYEAGFRAVLDKNADICASYANRRGLGYVDLCGERASDLRALAYTDESPNDGVVLSPALGPTAGDRLAESLRSTLTQGAAREVLGDTFNVDGFDVPPPGTYSALLSFLI